MNRDETVPDLALVAVRSWTDDDPTDRAPRPWSADAPTVAEGLPAWCGPTPSEDLLAWPDDDHTPADGRARLDGTPTEDWQAWPDDDPTPADGRARLDGMPTEDLEAWPEDDPTPADGRARLDDTADRAVPRIQAITPDRCSRLKDAWRNRSFRLICLLAGASLVVSAAWAARPAPATLPTEHGRSADGPSAPALFEAALGSIRVEDWDAAIPLLEEAAALDPRREEIARYLELTRAESAAADLLLRARRCLEGEDVPCVEGALAGIQPGAIAAARHAEDLRSRLEAIRLGRDDGGPEEAEPAGSRGVLAVAAQPGTDRSPRSGGGMGRTLGPAGRANAPSGGRAARLPGDPAGRGSRTHAVAGPSGEEAPKGDISTAKADAVSAERLVQAGVRARLADELELAAERFGQALALDPANREARAELEGVRANLSEIFRRAYARIDGEPERAARGLRLVSRLAPAGDPLRAKAEKWLARISSR